MNVVTAQAEIPTVVQPADAEIVLLGVKLITREVSPGADLKRFAIHPACAADPMLDFPIMVLFMVLLDVSQCELLNT